METPLNNLSVQQLTEILTEKRKLYIDMMNTNQEFEEVKSVFIELRALEQALQQVIRES